MGIVGDLVARKRRRPFLDPMTGGDAPTSDERQLNPNASSAHWQPLGFQNFPLRDRVLPDRRTAIFPSAIGRAYADVQLLNGVGQLAHGFNVPITHTPYYQSRPVQNPTLAQRYGGRAQQAPGPLTTQDWHDQMYSDVAATGGGPGTISLSGRVRKRLGWSL